MLRHESQDENESYVVPKPEMAEAAVTQPTAPLDRHIESFIDRTLARDIASLPYEEQQEQRAELRARIEYSVAAHLEIGASRDEALSLTLAQIRRENAATVHTAQQTVQSRPRPQPSARQATAIATGVFGLFYLLDQTRIAGHIWNMKFGGGMYNEAGGVMRDSIQVANFYRFELFVLPILCGLLVGLLAKYRPARGILNALGILAVPAIVWGGVAYAMQFAGITSLPQWAQYLFPNPLPAVAGIGAWALLGCLSATAGGWMRRRLPNALKIGRTTGNRLRQRALRIRMPRRRRDFRESVPGARK